MRASMARAPLSHAGHVRRARAVAARLALAVTACVSSLSAQVSDAAEAALSAASPEGAASDPDRSAQLFREGRELLARGALDEACRKFDASFELRRSPGTLLNIARCRTRAGDLLAALQAYRAALELSSQQPDPEKGQLWSAAAQTEIEALEPRLALLAVRVSHEGVSVHVDERPVSARGEIRLNPGSHRVRASAPGKRTLELGIELSEGQRLTLTVPPLGDDAAAPSPASPPVSPPAPPGVSPSAQSGVSPKQHDFSWQLPLLIGGGALFASGAVFGVLATKLVSAPDFDSPAESDRARSLALIADVLMGTGAVAIGFGIAWPWIDPEPAPSATSSRASQRAGLTAGCTGLGCRLELSGAF
jgi:hypothetical protein